MRGAWVEIIIKRQLCFPHYRRSPCGERGLKSDEIAVRVRVPAWSLPVRGAWVEMFASSISSQITESLPVRGAWVEMPLDILPGIWYNSRSPCGERGLKFPDDRLLVHQAAGRSPCGERGLKCPALYTAIVKACRSPCGERGLKSAEGRVRKHLVGRSPCGERGLKYDNARILQSDGKGRSPCGERGLKYHAAG